MPGSQPPTTTSALRTFFTFSQPCERRPGTYGQSSRLAMMPSSPWAREASSRPAPLPTWFAGVCHVGPAQRELGQARPPLLVGQLHQRVPLEPQQVEDHVDDGVGLRQPPHRVLGGQVHAALELLERGAAGIERDDLAVEDRVARAELRPEPAQLGVARRDVVAVAALEPQPPAVDVADRAHAVPLDLVGPLARCRAGACPCARASAQPLRHRLALRILGRIHAVDHPVVAAGPEQDVAAVQALAVEGDHHLLVAELVRLVGPAVPDLHRPRAVLAGRDVAARTRCTRAGGPRCGRPGGSWPDRAGCPSGPPRRRARRRAPGGDPSAAAARGARGPRSGCGASSAAGASPPGSGVVAKSRLER